MKRVSISAQKVSFASKYWIFAYVKKQRWFMSFNLIMFSFELLRVSILILLGFFTEPNFFNEFKERWGKCRFQLVLFTCAYGDRTTWKKKKIPSLHFLYFFQVLVCLLVNTFISLYAAQRAPPWLTPTAACNPVSATAQPQVRPPGQAVGQSGGPAAGLPVQGDAAVLAALVVTFTVLFTGSRRVTSWS